MTRRRARIGVVGGSALLATLGGWLWLALPERPRAPGPPHPLPAFVREAVPPPTTGALRWSFNGRDLADFTTFLRFEKGRDPDGVFTVQGGCLRVSGAEVGGITTRAEFADYHLVADWRWGGPTHAPRRWAARNSGILVHADGAEGDGLGAWMPSYETQLIEGGCGDLLVIPGPSGPSPPRSLRATIRLGADGQPYYQPGGQSVTRQRGRINWWGRDPAWADLRDVRGPDDPDRPVGEWNRTEVVCRGDTLRVFLNGRLVNAAEGLSTTSGRIQVQSEGAEIWFRRIEVRDLAPSSE